MKKNENLTQKQRRLLAGLAIAAFVIRTVLLICFVGIPIVRFASEPGKFRAWVNYHGFVGRLAYMGMVFIQVLAAVIPGEPLEIVGGYAFGAFEGTLLCLIASTIGSIAVFFLVRHFGYWLVEVFFSKEKIQSLRFLKSSPKRDFLFMIIFMLPGTPKDLLCYFAGLTDIRFGTWLLICSLGRIPSIVSSAVGGNALGTESYVMAVVVFVVTLLVSAGGMMLYNRICNKRSVESGGEEGESDSAPDTQENG
ncbi:MAG: TVP38/TMEM64 family protein [Oscillospiraceae bacterium]|nr:TVP38/TMEM64 family protein [Oscillospiraceae bacterium]